MAIPKTPPFFSILKYATFLHPIVRALYLRKPAGLGKRLMGLDFVHPIGVAAGVDKRGEFTEVMACYSPAFVEVGPIHDAREACRNLQKRSHNVIVLGNLSTTTNLVQSFTLLYDFVDILVLNVSQGTSVSKVIDHLLELRRYNDANKPIVFKLSHDLSSAELDEIAAYMLGSGIDGVMVGAEFIARIQEKTLGLLPIIATGEISTPARAAELLDDGASLVALTNSPVHYGPRYISKIVKYLEKR